MKKIILFAAAAMMAAVTFAQTPTVSASKVTMKYCKATYHIENVLASSASFPLDFVIQDGINDTTFRFTAFGSYVRKIQNVRGCDSVVTFVVGPNTEGVLAGKFTVNSNGKQVQFAKGNLQYKASNGHPFGTEGCLQHMTKDGWAQGVFQFAADQLTYAGNTKNNAKGEDPTSQEIQDIFDFGTSGYQKQPWNFSNCGQGNIAGTNHDWGVYNAILYGGNYVGLWRLISKAELNYILNSRTDASSKKGYATINGINGYMILPDDWTQPSNCPTLKNNTSYTTFSLEQWQAMEANGAVFFLTVGYYQSSYTVDNREGYYYGSDMNFGWENEAFRDNNGVTGNIRGHVRLVCDVEE